ncbi:MAG: fibronectin type III domain-containing protein [bacterium]
MSDPSNVVTTRLLSDVAPSTPSNLVAIAGNGQITLQWSASTTMGGPDIKGYKVEYRIRQINPTDTYPWTIFAGGVISTGTTAAITGLTNEVQYEFQVTAQNMV